MARKTVLVCDSCEKEIPDGEGATVNVVYSDARRSGVKGDYCNDCADGIKGQSQSRRGRPKQAVTPPAPAVPAPLAAAV